MVSYQKHGLSGRHQGESEQRISPPQHSESDSLWKRFDKTHLLSKLKIYFSYGTLLSEIAGPRSSCWNSHIKKKCPPKRNLSSSKTINTKSGWKESICGFTSNLSSSFTPFRERFDGPTFRGPDQPRLMGVVLRRRSFPGSIYIFEDSTLETWKNDRFWKLKTSLSPGVDSTLSFQPFICWGDSILQNGGRFINPLLVGACIGWFHTHHGLSRTTQDVYGMG